jgi:chromosome segregation ATPase
MQLNLGIAIDEETQKLITAGQGNSAKLSKQNNTCGNSMHGCLCQNKCDCSNSYGMMKGFENLLKNVKDTRKEDLSGSNDSPHNFGFDMTETEEQLHRFLKTEVNTHDVLTENENLKNFLKYMESNYKNQFATQRLIVEDLKLQVEDLLGQLRFAYSSLDQKNKENEDLLSNLERRKKDYDDIYARLKEKELLIIQMKNDKDIETDSKSKFKDQLDDRDRMIEDLQTKLKNFETKHKRIQDQLKNYVYDLQDRDRELRNIIDGQNDALEEFQRKVDELKRQNKEKDQQLQNKINEIEKINAQRLINDLAFKKKDNDRLREDLKRKDDELRKVKVLLGEAEDEVENYKKKAEQLKNAANRADGDEYFKQKQIEELKRKLMEADQKISEKDEIYDSLKRDYNDLLDKIHLNNEELARRQALLDFLNNELEKNKKNGFKNEPSSMPYNPAMGAENEILKRDNERLKDKIRGLENEVDNKNRLYEDADREAKHLKKILDDLEKKLKLITGEKDALRKLNDTAVNSSSIASANLNVELDKKSKLIKELKDKLSQLENDNLNLNSQIKNLQSELEKSKEAQSKLSEQNLESQILIDRLNKDKINLIKSIKTLKDERDALKSKQIADLKTINDQNLELDKLRKELSDLKGDQSRLKKEIDKLMSDHRELEAEFDKQKNQYLKLSQEYEKIKLQFAQDRDKMITRINELENALKKLGQDTKAKDELQEAKNKIQELMNEIERKDAEFKAKSDLLDDLKDENRAKDQRIEDLEMIIKKKSEELLALKTELDDNYHIITELLREVWSIKVYTYDFNSLLTERDTSDLKEQEKIVFAAKREQYLKMALEIAKDTKFMLKDTYEEAESLQSTVRNLSREKTSLLQKKQELEEKTIDLSKRHDAKTDMVGKLTVKVFILMTEIERMTISGKA